LDDRRLERQQVCVWIIVAGFQLEGKVCEDQDQLKMEGIYCWLKGGGGGSMGISYEVGA